MTTHIGNVWDGAIVRFPASARFFMKVCHKDSGAYGVVDISNGEYIYSKELDNRGFGMRVTVVAINLEDFVTEEEI